MNYYFFVALYFCACGATACFAEWILPSFLICAYRKTACTLLTLIITYYTLPLVKRKYFDKRISSWNKAVLITGCDTGFGHQLAKRLDAKGFHVFAGCLFPDGEGAKSLQETGSDRLRVLGLDVTKDESVNEAVDFVKSNLGKTELWGVVNNAGIYKGHEIAWTNLQCFKDCFEVNALGVVRVTKAFLPLLFKSKGRVVTVASMAGRVSTPAVGAYTMSKFASVAFCECLRQEVRPWGVKVVIIEPEAFKTQIMNLDVLHKSLKETVATADEDMRAEYGNKYFQSFKEQIDIYVETSSSRIYKVVNDLEDALSLLVPCTVYKPTRNISLLFIRPLIEVIPKPVFDTVVMWALKYIRGFPTPKGAENTP